MAQAQPQVRHLKVEIDPGAADQLRALIESLAEALERMTECARQATEMAAELTAVNTTTQATTEVAAFGDVPLQRMPASADYAIPRVIVTGVDAETLCPECRGGKFINCTRELDGPVDRPTGAPRCATWDTYMEDHEDGQTFGLWLLTLGMA